MTQHCACASPLLASQGWKWRSRVAYAYNVIAGAVLRHFLSPRPAVITATVALLIRRTIDRLSSLRTAAAAPASCWWFMKRRQTNERTRSMKPTADGVVDAAQPCEHVSSPLDHHKRAHPGGSDWSSGPSAKQDRHQFGPGGGDGRTDRPRVVCLVPSVGMSHSTRLRLWTGSSGRPCNDPHPPSRRLSG